MSISFRIDSPPSDIYDTFDGSGALDSAKWTSYEDGDTSGELTITQSGGQYNAAHASSSNAATTWFDAEEGRMDYVEFTGDFDFICRNVGIGTTGTASDYQFCGPIVWLSSDNYEFSVIGMRGGSSVVNERKSTAASNSTVSEHSGAQISGGFADIRVTRAGSTVSWYWQTPGTSPDSWTDITSSFASLGRVAFGTNTVRVGLVTYGFLAIAAFTGTCDQVEIPVGV